MAGPIRHKLSGWTRTVIADGSSRWTITPTDDSGDRIVRFLSAHSWANDPGDDKARADLDRVVLLDGAPLPGWAMDWLEAANVKSCNRGRDALRAAIDDADWHSGSRDGW